MATLEQLAEGIRRAHAAGDDASVQALGKAYRAMQGEPSQTFDEAMQRGSEMSQSLKATDQRPRPPVDFGTATAATLNGIVNGIPVIGPMARDITDRAQAGVGALFGNDYQQGLADIQKRREEINQAAPIANVAGEVAGNIGSLGGLAKTVGAEALGIGGKFLPGVLKSAASNQALYTADQYARGNSGMDTLGYGVPALVGAGGRVAGDLVAKGGQKFADFLTDAAQRRATSAAIKGAPSAADLKAASSAMFKAVDDAGVTVDPNRFGNFVAGLVQRSTKDRMNPTLDPKAYAALQEIAVAANETLKGGALTVSDLHTLRQIAQKAAMSAEGRDAMFANRIIEGLDDFVAGAGNTVMPKGGGTAGGNELLKAISTWGRARRVGIIEEAIYKAQNQASGFENGLRVQFRALLQNKKSRGLFTKAELQAIEEVANGTPLSNVVRLLGKFGFGGGSASNMLGGTIGFGAGSVLGGPVAGMAAAAVGTGARKASEALANRGAERAAQVVATPNIPTVPQLPNLLAPARAPLQIVVRGGGNAALN